VARIVKQNLPQPPPEYSQEYIAQLADAVNRYMIQREAQGEMIAARYIMTDPVSIPGDLPDTSTLPTGTEYLTPTVKAADDTILHQSWATNTITLTTTMQPIPGCSFTLTYAGRYLLMAAYDFTIVGNEQGALLLGGVTGSTHQAFCDTASKTGRNSVTLQGIFQATAGQVVALTAGKSGGGGNSTTGTECGLTVIWVGGAPVLGGFLTVVQSSDV
jgi:hypothetical protein